MGNPNIPAPHVAKLINSYFEVGDKVYCSCGSEYVVTEKVNSVTGTFRSVCVYASPTTMREYEMYGTMTFTYPFKVFRSDSAIGVEVKSPKELVSLKFGKHVLWPNKYWQV